MESDEEEVFIAEEHPKWADLFLVVVVIFVISISISFIFWAFFYYNIKPVTVPTEEIDELKQQIANLRADAALRISEIENRIASLPSRSSIIEEIRLRIAEELNRIASIEDLSSTRNYIDLQLQQIITDIDVRFNSLTISPNVTIYDEEGNRQGSFSGLQFTDNEIVPRDNVCLIGNKAKFWVKKTNYMMTMRESFVEFDLEDEEINSTFTFDLYLTLSVDLEKYLQCEHYYGVIRIGANGDAYMPNSTNPVVVVSGEIDDNGLPSKRTIITSMTVSGKVISIKMIPNLAFQKSSVDVSIQYRSFKL